MLATQNEYQMLLDLKRDIEELNRRITEIVICEKIDTQALAKFKPLDKQLKSKEQLYRTLICGILTKPPVQQHL